MLVLIVIGSMIYALPAYRDAEYSPIGHFIGAFFVPILISFVICAAIESVKTILKKSYRFNSFVRTWWLVFIPVILLAYSTLYFSNDAESVDIKEVTYKKYVQERNTKSKKRIGDVDSEFLNEDNLYENFKHNYTVKFPINYKVNYGMGRYSEIQAYDTLTGRMISISVADSKVKNPFDTKKEHSDFMVKGMFEELKNKKYVTLLERTFEERGLADVVLSEYDLTNYNNRVFIRLDFDAKAIVDNKSIPIVVRDFVTFHDSHIYHFAFRTPQILLNDKFEHLVLNTMQSVMVSDYISN